ncbi:MAG: hypothetical protein E4G94_04670 [ANME-2 cluster archaeon]|nr:MAG: hypothetical protein E4G94_04670 [ANME-2 cluster archaeon]
MIDPINRTVRIFDGTNVLKLQHLLAQTEDDSTYVIGRHKGTYTINDGTWVINYTGFAGLTLENFPKAIINLTTGEIYDTTNMTVAATTITIAAANNVGLTEPATGDLLYIRVMGDVRGYDDLLDLIKMSWVDPDRNQILNETQHLAITAATNGVGVNVSDMNRVSCVVEATGVTNGGTVTVQGSSDDVAFGPVPTVGLDGVLRSVQTIAATGNYEFKVVNCDPLYLRADLTTRTDGTYTIKLTGRA